MASSSTLRFTTCQAQNADELVQSIVGYLGARLAQATELVITPTWRQREHLLDKGGIQVGWICGLPYVWKADQPRPPVELLAAPVMQAARYQSQPIYFSDVLVHHLSPYRQFADLRGATWAYNEPRSHSGYNLTRYHLAQLGETGQFFGQVIQAGTHQAALNMLLDRRIHAIAIDSTVLETELRRRPTIASQLRTIATLGPSPIPPWVVHKSLPEDRKEALRALFLAMHTDPHGRAVLASGRVQRFVAVTDRDYDPIRHMQQVGSAVTLKKTTTAS